MKKLFLALLFLIFPLSLSSCGAIAESLINGALGIDNDENDERYFESREKRERRSYYRSGNKPSLADD